MITAAVDGSSLKNPGPAGWAWYVDRTCWAAGGWPLATNNRGELTALLALLRATAAAGRAGERLLVLADSQYVIDSVTKWMPGWKRRGWRKADGKAVLNADLMRALDEAMQGRDVSFQWVKGHDGHPLNEAADERARSAAMAFQMRHTMNGGPGFGGITGAETAVPASDPSPDGQATLL